MKTSRKDDFVAYICLVLVLVLSLGSCLGHAAATGWDWRCFFAQCRVEKR